MDLYTARGVTVLRSPLIPCPHGFSTRQGGVSTLPYTASLNLGYARGDSDETVRENLARFSSAIGISSDSVVALSQVHGTEILYCTEEDCGRGYLLPPHDADGAYTDRVGVTVAVKTADCVPILLCGCDDSHRAVAVMALHAGWRGTLGGIAERGVRRLLSLGIHKEEIFAAIGPSIGICCYEVDDDFYGHFTRAFSAELLDGTFRKSTEKDGKWYCDLSEINRRLLLRAGIRGEHIDASSLCTACRQDLFYSHRASGGQRGSMLSMIALPNPCDS